MIQENEIRAQLLEYLSRNHNLDEFEDWFVQRSWNMHRDSDPGAQKLVSKIELALSEYSSGHGSEAALRNLLSELHGDFNLAVDAPLKARPVFSNHSQMFQFPRFQVGLG